MLEIVWTTSKRLTFQSSGEEIKTDDLHRKTENHLFKWIDEALIEEIRMVDSKHERVAQVITKFEERVMEKVKSEMPRVEHQMSEKLKEKGGLEIARVAHEMKHKLKIATVAMVVVGAIVGIWTSLSV
uniref:Uncharacterized protein n=1 Tax=Brassica oleracea var. oleracea TaxID=109376 RepID=A0A0D3E963_BRAOL